MMVIEVFTFEFWFTLLLQKVLYSLCIYVCVKKNLLSFTMVIDFKIPAFLCEPRNSGMSLPFEGQSAFLENSLFYINVL